jgi:glutamate:GABA antiporter
LTLTDTPPRELASERLVPMMLPRVLTTRDLGMIFIAITLFISNGAAIQPAGPAAFGWWLLAFALFFLPGAVATQRLARLLPGEGSIYLWTHRALGPFWGFFAGFCSWWPGLLALVALGPVALGFLGYVLPDVVGSATVEMQGIAVVAIVSVTAGIAVQRLRVVQTAVNVAIGVYLIVVVVVLAAGALHLLAGSSAAVDPTIASAYSPSSAHGLNAANWTFFGLAVLALLGVEVPLNLGAEIRSGVRPGRFLRWGCPVIMLSYVVVTWGIMVTVPQADATSSAITPIPEAIALSFGATAGKAAALVLAACTIMMGAVYQCAFSRLLFVSALDRTLPEYLARLNRRSAPANAIWAQTMIVSVVVTVAFIVLPVLGFGGSPADIQTKTYDVLQASVALVWCLSMVFLFIDAVLLSRAPDRAADQAADRADRAADRLAQRRRTRRAAFAICCGVGAVSSAAAIITILSGSWTPLISNSTSLHLLGATIQWGTWSWSVLVVSLVSLVAGATMYVLGERVHRRADARMLIGALTSQT